MVITNHGLDCFKLQYGDTVLAMNPPSDDSDRDTFRWGADVAMSSIRHPDYTGGSLLTGGDKTPIELTGPGEYEIDDISITGVGYESNYADDFFVNTIYNFRLQDMDVCFIGPVKDRDFPADTQEVMEGIDILFVPITGTPTLDASEAYKLAVQIEPKIVIPTHFTAADESVVDGFLKEAGADDTEKKEKLTISPRDLSGRDTDIEVVMPDT